MSADAERIQRVLHAAGYYNGAIDGILGAKSWGGIQKILSNHAGKLLPESVQDWSESRRSTAAVQLVLAFAGYSVGEIDGYWGNQTEGAYLEWNHAQVTGGKLELKQSPTSHRVANANQNQFPLQSKCPEFYGMPGKDVESQLVTFDLPYKMVLDWNTGLVATRATLHKKCVDSAVASLEEALDVYGLERLYLLGLNRTAGTYVNRKMRGGSSPSMHAYGAAWDFYARPNGLTTRCPQALFCQSDYNDWFDIWESNGWVSLGREIGRDWMHLQAARLT